MSMQLYQITVETNQDGVMNNVDDALVERLWQDLDEQLSREQIGRVVAEIASSATDESFSQVIVSIKLLRYKDIEQVVMSLGVKL